MGLSRWACLVVVLSIVVLAPAVAPQRPPASAWDGFRAKWAEAFHDHPEPASVTIQHLSIVDGKLVKTPETLPTTEFLALARSVATKVPAPRAAPMAWLIVGHQNPQVPTLGLNWIGFSVFDCAHIEPMTGVADLPQTDAPDLGQVQSAGILGLGLSVEEQTGIALGDAQILPEPAPFPVLDAPVANADVAVLRADSFSLCYTLFGIPLFSTTFLDMDGDLSA